MIRVQAFLSLLLLATISFAGDKEQRANQLFQRAEQVNQFKEGDLPAFHQEVHFLIKAPGQPEVPGIFIRDYLDRDHFRSRITASLHDESFVRNGQKVYTKSSSPTTPVIVSTIENLVPPLYYPINQKVSRIFSVSSGVVSLQCVEFKESLEKFCFDDEAKLIRHESYSGIITFSAFRSFGTRSIPGHFELLTNDGTTVLADMKSTVSNDLRSELFEPPSSAGFKEETRPNCKLTSAPSVRYAPDPEFPEGGMQGIVGLWMMIGTDGIPHDIKVSRSLTPANDREAIKAVGHWKFKPAGCDGKPMSTQINVEVTFRKY